MESGGGDARTCSNGAEAGHTANVTEALVSTRGLAVDMHDASSWTVRGHDVGNAAMVGPLLP